MSDANKKDIQNLTEFSALGSLVDEIAEMRGDLSAIRNLSQQGTFINLNDLIYTSRGIYQVYPDSTLKKILLYQGERHFRMTDKLEDSIDPSFHIYKCDIVKKQIEQKSKFFKITTRKDGNFHVKDYKFDENMKRTEEESQKKLLICNLCFVMYGRIRRTSIPKEDFKIKEFLEPGYSSLTFTYNFDEIPVGFKSNWAEIANALKENKNYKCEKCGIVVEKLFAEKFLNIHYTQEKIYTKYRDKVKMLCIRCHSEEPGHEHIKEKSEYKNFVETVLKKG